jgi:hypothetical protein
MSTFMDDNMAPLSHDVDVVVVSCGNEISSHWGATHASPTLSGIAFEAALGPDPTYASTAFLGIPPKFGHPSDTTAWPWSDSADEYASPPPLEYGLGSAPTAPGLPANFAGMPALPGYINVATDKLPGAVFAARHLDRPFLAYHSHIQ